MKNIMFLLIVMLSTTIIGQKTYEFQKIRLIGSDHKLTTRIELDRCMDVENDYCVARIEIEGNPKMDFTVESTTLAPNGKLMLIVISNYNNARAHIEINPEETVALFLHEEKGVFAFFKK